MTTRTRRARWAGFAVGVVALFWLSALVGGLSPDVRRLAISLPGATVADYSTDGLLQRPLTDAVITDASNDQAGRVAKPSASPGPSSSPSGSQSVRPSPSPTSGGVIPTPTLPVPTPTLPIPTPTLPTPPLTPAIPAVSPSIPSLR